MPRYDFHYDSPQKHLYNVFFLGSTPSGKAATKQGIILPAAGVDFPGATHCEEVPYIFDVRDQPVLPPYPPLND